MKGPENTFRDKTLRPALEKLPKCFHILKEAGTIRGLADIWGYISTRIFLLEVKASKKEAEELEGRIVLQRYNLEKARKRGVFAEFVYPENLDEILKRLEEYGKGK